ncbi:hypothetical protein NRIC_04960 [Enterococcus florum]|uniref:AraC effector-binding domain-containing protein n=1 Tax=Enterococcus florum TaxID=2480627 RepID=A0A4P5P483_9ENTE|nr:AraC family transcriptional regulator [Enterococcus florum]GCF92605.1 hypothetical protein NRIC_04960 [Enterococcus florum]
MQIEKITKPDQLIVSTSAHLSYEHLPEYIGRSYIELLTYSETHQAATVGTPFVSYLNLGKDGMPKDELYHVEIGLPIDRMIPENEKFQVYTQPAYQAMRTLIIGDYDELTEPYKELLQAIKYDNGVFASRSYEYFLTNETVPLAEQETMIELAYIPKKRLTAQ